MECNKEEAMRAKDIARKRLAAGDFSGAQKIARKAQQLFPALDNVTQLLTACEVHCSAQNKILGTEMDWYTILQIERTADEITIKKQYRKLALMLHPDKNKFPGAEAAFKLIGEANRVLSDKAKCSVYDLKFRTVKAVAPKPQAQPSQRNTFRKQQTAASNFHNAPHSQYGATNNVPKPPFMQFAGVHPSQNADKTTFWTCCGNCNIRFQYLRTHVNNVLRCQSCQQSFTAYDLGSRGVPPGQPWSHFPNQNGFPNPGPSKVPSQSNPSKVVFQSNRGKPSATTQEKVDVRMNVKDGVRMHKPNEANGKKGVGKAKPDGGKSSECGTSSTSEKKRKRKPESESSAKFMQFAGVHPSQNADKTTFRACCGNCNIRYKCCRTRVNKVLRCHSCQQSFTAYDLGSRGVPPGHPWSHFPNQNGIPNPLFQNGFPNPGPSKVPSQSNPSKVASQSNRGKLSATTPRKSRCLQKDGVRMHKPNPSKVASQSNDGKPSATTQEKVDVRMNVKDSVRMHKPNVGPSKVPSQSNPSKVASQSNHGDVRMNVKGGVRMHNPNVANGKEGVGEAKPDRGKPSECGTSRSSKKKRMWEPESESSAT